MKTVNEAKKTPTTKKAKDAKFKKVMGEFGKGKLRSGSKKGPKVTDQKQAVAIAFSESGQSNETLYSRARLINQMNEFYRNQSDEKSYSSEGTLIKIIWDLKYQNKNKEEVKTMILNMIDTIYR